LVDDQPEVRRVVARNLSRAGYSVVEAWNGCIALDLVRQGQFDVVISDLSMPDMGGIELMHTLRVIDPDLPVVLTSGSPGYIGADELDLAAAFAYLEKPVAANELRDTTRRAVDERRARLDALHSEEAGSITRLRLQSSSHSA
jgi:two-component system, NtrC family, C4-dicarboxylate transport response regulator DctD